MKNLINRSDLEQEIWLPVVGYEGLYEDSNLGRVKSLERKCLTRSGAYRTVPERILQPTIGKNGYLYVDLYKDGKRKTHLVHRLVATSFIPNPHSLPQVNHLDENPLNNRANNLEFCTNEYNSNYGTRNKRISKVQRNDIDKSKTVLQLTLDGKLVREWPSVREAERNGYNQGYISACCRGEYGHKTYKGYIWKYKEQP